MKQRPEDILGEWGIRDVSPPSHAEHWNFSEVNDLIDRHNRWYPIEARLAMDPRTRDYVKVGGRPYRREPLDLAWILERFPYTASP